MTYQMRPPNFIYCLSIVQLDIQVLVDALQCPADLDFVLEFHGDFMLDEGLEEAMPSLACFRGELIEGGGEGVCRC